MTLPEGWKERKLSQLCYIKIGGTPSRSVAKYWAKGHDGHPWVSISDLLNNPVKTTKEYITTEGVDNSNVKLIFAGTVLMSFKLTVGRISRAAVPLYTNEAIAAFEPLSEAEITSDYLYFTLPLKLGGLEHDKAVKGITLNKAKLQNLPIVVPSPGEQQKITEILNGVDATIKATQDVIDQTERTKIALMNEFLISGLFDKHKEFKSSSFGDVPKSWDVRPLGTLFDLVERRVDMDDDEEYQLVTVKRRNGGVVERERLPGKKIKVKNQYWIEEGDFLISKRQIVHGACEIVPAALSGAIVSNEYHTLRAKDDLYLPYFRWISRAAFMYRYFLISSVGVHIEKMLFKLDQWSKLEIPLPPLDEQKKITEILESTENSAAANQARLDQLQKLKAALMQVLLTGKVRVPVAENSESQNQRREAANG